VSTIYAVAKRAGVSTATVSRVLSRPQVVTPSTRDRVLQAIEDLSYAPNSAARNLRTLKSGKLLVTVPDISNPFFSLILQGIEDAAQRAGYAVLLGDTQHNARREERYAQMLKHKEADGLIFLGHRLPKVASEIVRGMAPRCAPIVNGCEFSPHLGVPGVHIDNARAASEAMDHLYSLGHRRIGVVTGPLLSPLSRDRLRGTRARAVTENAEEELTIIPGDFSIASGVTAGEELLGLANRPTAVFCFNDEMAMGVVEGARAGGLRLPEELSIVGFDDIRFANHVNPPLTTIAQPMREIGESTVRMLLTILDNPDVYPMPLTLPHRLVVRQSTAPALTIR
jgi:LacI family repressor for deo operon, udp, cdd, tsx, nupC, and nupG